MRLGEIEDSHALLNSHGEQTTWWWRRRGGLIRSCGDCHESLQREFDHFISNVVDGRYIYLWQDHEKKNYELVTRYFTSAKRKFQRELRMLEQFYKTHCKPAKPVQQPELSEEDDPEPQLNREMNIWFVQQRNRRTIWPRR